MPQSASAAAITSLTEWWEEMGASVDEAEIRAILASAQQELPENSLTKQDQPQAAPPARTSRRRKKTNSLEDWVSEATQRAAAANTLADLKQAIEQFDGSPLKTLCEKTVVYDGTLDAQIMVIGEGPGPQEDRQGLPFVGPAGQLLDKMLAAIGLDRKTNTFITNVNYWRPPGNRNPEADELAVCRPFVERMIDLSQPRLIIAAGGVPAKFLLETSTGIMRLRGRERPFETPAGTAAPLVPILHPAYLLRRPQDKSRAWRDLLMVQARLEELGVKI